MHVFKKTTKVHVPIKNNLKISSKNSYAIAKQLFLNGQYEFQCNFCLFKLVGITFKKSCEYKAFSFLSQKQYIHVLHSSENHIIKLASSSPLIASRFHPQVICFLSFFLLIFFLHNFLPVFLDIPLCKQLHTPVHISEIW